MPRHHEADFGVATDQQLPVRLVHALISAMGAGFAGLIAARFWGQRASTGDLLNLRFALRFLRTS